MDIEIKGCRELERKLEKLADKTARKFVRQSLKKGGTVFAIKTRKNAKNMVGGIMGRLISKLIKVRAAKKQKPGEYSVNAKLDSVRQFFHTAKDGEKSFIPAAIEYGHAGPGGEGGRVAKPIPFMRNAHVTVKELARGKVIKDLWAKIRKEGAKGVAKI